MVTYLADLLKSLCVIVSLAAPLAWSKDGSAQVQPIPADVGLVTQLSGDVTYWNEAYHKTPEKAVAFMKIRKGDHFALPEGARLQVVYFASNRQESWAGPARLVIGQAESENLSRDAQPEVIVLPPGASQGVQRIPALLRRAGLSRTGGLQVRGMTPPQAPGGLSPDEEAEIQNARRNYQDLRKQAKPDDLTPELYLLGILADYEQFEEMEKVLKDAQTRQPGNEVLKELEAWVRTQRSQPGKKK
ncbi:MAG: hypothetical protein ACUVXD_00365 [Thermodesulfobacteriota bacterium]